MAAPRTYVTADTHFGHAEAIGLFKRPFANVTAMDEALIDAINEVAGPDDRLLHLGDFTGPIRPKRDLVEFAKSIRRRLRCRTIELVAGNHDPIDREDFRAIFDAVHELPSWKDDAGLRIVCCHYPLRTWQGRLKGAVHLYGHCHGALRDEGRSSDVGIDARGLRPLELSGLVAELASRPIGV
jgi:calcineurin-like phosphoesterase family protein